MRFAGRTHQIFGQLTNEHVWGNTRTEYWSSVLQHGVIEALKVAIGDTPNADEPRYWDPMLYVARTCLGHRRRLVDVS